MEHPTSIPGYPEDMKKLAEDIGNLRYDKLDELFCRLLDKIHADKEKDRTAGRRILAQTLEDLAYYLDKAQEEASYAWEICEPHMEKKE